MKKKLLAAGLCLSLLSMSILCGFMPAAEYAAGKDKVKAVTYFGDAWPINFWSSEMDGMAQDFQKIREDGFNHIILCVPWNEFQPEVLGMPEVQNKFNTEALSRLDAVMSDAEKAGLGVMLRLGYTWDYYDSEDVLKRYEALINDKSVRAAWLAYAKKIYETVSAHQNFTGAFLTWEDFWNFVDTERQIAGTIQGEQKAKELGFSDYVLGHYTRAELEQLYHNPQDALTGAFPKADSPAYRLFLEWYDKVLTDLLTETQTVFPDLSMECRLDVDSYRDEAGALLGYAHNKTFACGNASYASTMLSVSMGHQPGTKLLPERAADMSAAQIGRLNADSGKPLFVDQFLYMETTPGYENNASLAAEDVNTYLAQMGDVFRRHTMGYGIWTYRDYADNILYNPGFALGLEGWSKNGTVNIAEQNGKKMAKLQPGALLVQSIEGRNYISKEPSIVRIKLETEQPVVLTVMADGESRMLQAEKSGTFEVKFNQQAQKQISIRTSGAVLLDNVEVYSHLTRGDIYDRDGNPGRYLEGIRACNAALDGKTAAGDSAANETARAEQSANKENKTENTAEPQKNTPDISDVPAGN